MLAPVLGIGRLWWRTTSRAVDAAVLAGVDALLASRTASEVVDRVAERLLQSEQLWRLVEEIARSPAVADAIAHQGIGFADQVADNVRARSRDADAWLERAAGRALRRRPPARSEPA